MNIPWPLGEPEIYLIAAAIIAMWAWAGYRYGVLKQPQRLWTWLDVVLGILILLLWIEMLWRNGEI
jgi:hypothetical protein